MSRRLAIVLALPSVVVGLSRPGACQTSDELQSYLTKQIGFTLEQVKEIRAGKPVIKVIKSRTPADIIIFGAVYINATPERYIKLYYDVDGFRTFATNLAAGKVGNPPAVSDLDGFRFDAKDVKELRTCKPRDCKIQLRRKAWRLIRNR